MWKFLVGKLFVVLRESTYCSVDSGLSTRALYKSDTRFKLSEKEENRS